METIIPRVSNETDLLKVVVLGLPESMGSVPELSEAYDAKSYETIARGVYPTPEAVACEMEGLRAALERDGVEVLRPSLVKDYNQVFARDVAFVVDNTLFVSNLIPDREKETGAFQWIIDRIPSMHVESLPEQVHAEGGDIVLYDDILFVGCYLRPDYPTFKMARTNQCAVDFFRERFPRKRIIPIELHKHDRDPRRGILHLDCAFQPVGRGRALLFREALMNKQDAALLEEIFGRDNIFDVTPEEAYSMHTNVVSLSPKKLVSDVAFSRLNHHLTTAWGIEVEPVPYQEISKMGGLLRCSTMPLVRVSTQ